MSTNAVGFDSPTFTAMDIWFYTCRFLVGGAILEFLFVLKKTSKPAHMRVKTGPHKIPSRSLRSAEEESARCDRNAFIIFIAVFVVFCVIYFSVCFSLR